MATVGSVILTKGSGSTASVAQMVSPIIMSSMPVTATISPMLALSTGTRLSPSNANRLLRRKFSWRSGFRLLQRVAMLLSLSVPRVMRPMPIRPTNSL